MSEEEIFQIVREIVVEQLDRDESDVTMEASFQDDLGADSLDLVELIMEFEARFETVLGRKVEISDDAARDIETVGDAVSYIQQLTAAQ